jgi:hypothetical protein
MKRIILALIAVSAAGAAVAVSFAALAAPNATFSQRSVPMTIKPEFTRPGGQPGAAREIAPAKPVPVQRRRGKTAP